MTWNKYFMDMAIHAASKSKDPSTRVGAVLVGEHREILLTAFNGLPIGVVDDPKRLERPSKYLWTSHAEENLIAFAARNGIRTEGRTVVTTCSPCCRCARGLIQAGIRHIIYGPQKTSMPEEEFITGLQMFSEAGVKITRLWDVGGEDGKTDDSGDKAAVEEVKGVENDSSSESRTGEGDEDPNAKGSTSTLPPGMFN